MVLTYLHQWDPEDLPLTVVHVLFPSSPGCLSRDLVTAGCAYGLVYYSTTGLWNYEPRLQINGIPDPKMSDAKDRPFVW
jgi:hypothetical protein